MLDAVTLAGNAQMVREEITELRHLAGRAKAVEDAHVEMKLTKLKGLLHSQGFFDRPDQRLLLFTEFKDTLAPRDHSSTGPRVVLSAASP